MINKWDDLFNPAVRLFGMHWWGGSSGVVGYEGWLQRACAAAAKGARGAPEEREADGPGGRHCRVGRRWKRILCSLVLDRSVLSLSDISLDGASTFSLGHDVTLPPPCVLRGRSRHGCSHCSWSCSPITVSVGCHRAPYGQTRAWIHVGCWGWWAGVCVCARARGGWRSIAEAAWLARGCSRDVRKLLREHPNIPAFID